MHAEASTAMQIDPRVRCLDIDQVVEATGESRSVIYDKVAAGEFPKGFKIGRRRRWRLSTLIKYLDGKEHGR